jgi:hypothetical protein
MKPQWVTSQRKIYLSQTLINYLSSLKGWKLDLVTGEFYNPQYDDEIQRIISNWKTDDREAREALWKVERKTIHALNEKPYHNGRFGSVSSVIWHESQPLYYMEGLGMSGLTLKPFVKVKLSSSYNHLYIDLGDSLRTISKNRKRKAIRYGKPLPNQVNEIVSSKAGEGVLHYLNH